MLACAECEVVGLSKGGRARLGSSADGAISGALEGLCTVGLAGNAVKVGAGAMLGCGASEDDVPSVGGLAGLTGAVAGAVRTAPCIIDRGESASIAPISDAGAISGLEASAGV